MVLIVTSVCTLAVGYLLGQLRPWRCLGDWAAAQVRFTGSWVRGSVGRQAVVVLVHAATAPRASWRIIRAPAAVARTPVPTPDPDWLAHRTQTDEEGTA